MKIRECVLSDLILVSRFSCEDGGIERDREVMKERDCWEVRPVCRKCQQLSLMEGFGEEKERENDGLISSESTK